MNRKTDFFIWIKKHAVVISIIAVSVIFALLVFDGVSDAESSVSALTVSVEEYRLSEEKKLKNLLEEMKGVGKTEVMIVVSKGEEIVTAKDISSTSEKTIVLDRDGEDTLSVISTVSPVISGVVVVCDGGGNITVKNEIVSLVARLYGLSAAEIYVSERGKD